MSKIKYVLIAVDEEDSHILDNIPENNIIEEVSYPKEDVDVCGHPIIYTP